MATADGRELKVWEVPELIGSICLTKQGNALVAGQTGLFEFDFESEQTELIFTPQGMTQDQRLNDGKVDRNGHFFFGGMACQLKIAHSRRIYGDLVEATEIPKR